MSDSLALFTARSQLMAHQVQCRCSPCRDARVLLDADAAKRREALLQLDPYTLEAQPERPEGASR